MTAETDTPRPFCECHTTRKEHVLWALACIQECGSPGEYAATYRQHIDRGLDMLLDIAKAGH